jgi:uncharacterized phage infection (PIP) family protein YhgE
MPWGFSRTKSAEAAEEIANHLRLVDHVKALQTGQKELAEAIATLSDRLGKIEAQMGQLKAETRLEAVKEAQSVVYAVQSNLNQRIQDLAVKLAVAEASDARPAQLPRPSPDLDGG